MNREDTGRRARFAVALVLVFLCSFILAPASQAQKLQDRNGKSVDFSGHWEMDYGDSDNIQITLNKMVRELQRRAQRAQASSNMNRRSTAAPATLGVGSYNSGPSIIGLAQMADDITQSQLLQIKQNEHDIAIKREQTFDLTCEFYGEYFQSVETLFGKESCGWDSHQLLFRILLPEGLSIQHRFTLGPSGDRLNIATTVLSDRVSYPFTVNRVFNRYEPAATGISCELTLTRGKVCTTEATP